MSNISDLFEALISTPIQDLEDRMRVLYFRYSIDDMSGDNLDVIGDIIGQDRIGMDDENYRKFIKAKIGLNVSEGTVDHILRVWSLLTGSDEVTLQQIYPCRIKLSAVMSTPSGYEESIWNIMESMLVGGVGLYELWFDDPTDFGFGPTRGLFGSDWTSIYKKS